MKPYFICTAPRSGSNLLCEALSSTGVAGRPLEYFNVDYREFFLDKWKCPHSTSESVFRELIFQAGTTPNGVFGAKVQWFQVRELSGNGTMICNESQASAKVSSNFPQAKYVLLTRNDKLRQAISWYRASYKNTWWSIEGVLDPRSRTAAEPPFEYSAIHHYIEFILEYERAWVGLFSDICIVPLRIEYGELEADLNATVKRVLEFIDIPEAAWIHIAPPRLEKQADWITEQWVHAYVTDERRRANDDALYGPDHPKRKSTF
jgi:trehalose 2-sulfotransferase